MGRWILAVFLGVASAAVAGDRLVVTGGAQQLEGTAGGGLVPWAFVAGYGTRDQVGGSAFLTRVDTNDFDLASGGVAVGILDRFEFSYARQRFDAGAVVPGLVLRQDIVGAKWRVAGDAVYDQASPWPQVALGLQYKRNRDMVIPEAIGAKRGSDTDLYAAFTKLWLAGLAGRNVLANLTVRATRANQMGLLGFGGDKEDRRKLVAEASVALMLTDRLAVGAEYRGKPDNLSAFREDDFSDLFVAWFPNKRVAVTLAWARLGSIAGLGGQEGAYLSVQLTE